MILGYNDWDRDLDEWYLREVRAGRIIPPPPPPAPALEDYGRIVTFTLEDLGL